MIFLKKNFKQKKIHLNQFAKEYCSSSLPKKIIISKTGAQKLLERMELGETEEKEMMRIEEAEEEMGCEEIEIETNFNQEKTKFELNKKEGIAQHKQLKIKKHFLQQILTTDTTFLFDSASGDDLIPLKLQLQAVDGTLIQLVEESHLVGPVLQLADLKMQPVQNFIQANHFGKLLADASETKAGFFFFFFFFSFFF